MEKCIHLMKHAYLKHNVCEIDYIILYEMNADVANL